MRAVRAVLGLLAILVGSASGVIVHDADYAAQQVASYSVQDLGYLYDIAVDSTGNAYLAYKTGSIQKVSGSGDVSTFASDLERATAITYSNGGDFGTALYVSDQIAGKVYRYDLNGSRTTFAGVVGAGSASAIYSSYGYDALYVYGSHGIIHKFNSDGEGTVFADMPDQGGIHDFDFDMSGDFGARMYAATVFSEEPGAGIVEFLPDGSSEKILPEFTRAQDVAFSTAGAFGDDLFVMTDMDVWRVDSTGEISLFASDVHQFGFGPDGTMYLYQVADDMGTLYRVVPEPTTMALLGLGGVVLVRRRKRG